jgi:hypothetical protein
MVFEIHISVSQAGLSIKLRLTSKILLPTLMVLYCQYIVNSLVLHDKIKAKILKTVDGMYLFRCFD